MAVRRLLEDWTLKLFSLAVAIALYFFVSTENTSSIEVDFRLEYQTADEMMLTHEPPIFLHATLQGPGASFRRLDASDLKPVVLDLRQAEPGSQRQTVDIATLSPPSGMRVVAVRPAEIEVTLERRVERLVPIRPDFPQGPADGFEIVDVHLTPTRARVIGPASKMQGLEAIVTRPIDVSGREDDLRVEVDLRPPLSPMRLLDKSVAVFIEVAEEFIQRTFGRVAVVLDQTVTDGGWTAREQLVPVTLRGPKRAIRSIDGSKLTAQVGLGEGLATDAQVHERAVAICPNLPERVQMVAPVPKVTLDRPPPKRSRRRG